MRKIHLLLAALLASLAATAVVVTIGSSSSHREAPLTSADPTADDTDVYAFTAAENPGALTVVANWVPFEDPAGGPNFYRFDDRARYYINIDNTGDGDYDVRYRFDFRTKFNDKNFLHSLTQVTSLNDPELFQKESYEVVRETFNSRGRRTSARSLGRNFRVAPSNVGPKTMPDYETLANSAIRSLPGGGKVFAGQRDDAFFLPLDRVFDSVNLEGAGTGNMGGGIDTLAGYGVQTIVLQVPEARVTRDRKAVGGADGGQRRRRRVGVDRAPAPAGDQQRLGQQPRGAAQRLGAGQPPGQPARQRAVHPPDAEGQVQPHPAVRRPEELRQVRAEPVPGGRVQPAVRRSASRRPTAPTSCRRCSPASRA